MLDYLLEEPVECFKSCVWNKQWLMDEFQETVVGKIIRQCWAIDEMEAGVPISKIEDEIWLGYEDWAEEYLMKHGEFCEDY